MEGQILKQFLKANRLTNRDLAEKLKITPQAVGYLLKKKRFTAEQIETFENIFGKGFLHPDRIRQIQLVKDNSKPSRMVPYYTNEGSYTTISPALSDEVAFKKETFYKIPHFEKADAMIRVSGHSMRGKINDGDYIVIRLIQDIDRIIYGEIYYIITKSNRLKTVKIVKRHQDDDDLLWLVPHNTDQFEPQEIEKSDILEMYKVEGGVAVY